VETDGTAPETEDPALEAQIGEWVAYMRRRRELSAADADELEDHLRNRIGELISAGLQPDEAFLIAVKRMGSLDEVSREFAREHSERLWKQLVLAGGGAEPASGPVRLDLWIMIACAAVAAIAIKIPAAFGLTFADDYGFYGRNFSFFALVPLAAYFVWSRRVRPAIVGVIAALFVVGVVGANVYPLSDDANTTILTAIHLPIALWLVVGVAYAGGDWRSDRRRMDFIRFTGEFLIYYVLIALGGGVLNAFTLGVFHAIGVDAGQVVSEWVLPCGAMAAVVVAAWLVGWKQSVIENMAPVLTRIFTPLFAVVLLAFVGAVIWTGNGIDIQRDVLIMFDLLLVAVLGLLLYGISARDPDAPRGWFDRLQFALVISALVIDVLVLLAVNARIADFGFSANKTAALGENIILLVNLAWSAWLLFEFLWRRAPYGRLDRWQTGYLIVYAAWAWFVVLAFPPIFHYA
jgi:hypothetical protein